MIGEAKEFVGAARRRGRCWSGSAFVLFAAIGALLGAGCRQPTPADRLSYYREGVEEVLGQAAAQGVEEGTARGIAPGPGDGSPLAPEQASASDAAAAVSLPHRRKRILAVPDHRIGPFDYLATLGCRLSEVIAARNGSLGRVLEPTRRLAHELDVIRAGEACRPRLGEARAERLAAILEAKREALPRHAWNAVWLDRNLERFLSSGPAALIGGRDASDGGLQLTAAAAAIRARDPDAVDDAFEQLRDDPPAGPRLRTIARSTHELARVAALVGSVPVDRCTARTRRLVGLFSERFVPARTELVALDRDARGLEEGVSALFEALDPIELSPGMRAYREAVAGDARRPGVAGALRAAILSHARAMGEVLAVCGAAPAAG